MNIDEIRDAQQRISGYVKRTPTELSKSLRDKLGCEVYVKYELFQKTGSFKPRGAFNKLLSMTDEERSHGTVAVSGGNHAQAVAYASTSMGLDSVIVMPANTPQHYLDATRGYGATVDLQPTIADAFAKVGEYMEKGRAFLHPYDDPKIIAGQGTVGLEILEDVPDVTDIFVSIGGGGLAGGVASAARGVDPNIRVWGVETYGADAMARAIEAGHPVEMDAITSIAKTLGAPYVTENTLNLAQELLESVTVVTDDEAVDALLFIAERLKVLPEPASSCTLAAAEKLRGELRPDSKVALILCGGNVSIREIGNFLASRS